LQVSIGRDGESTKVSLPLSLLNYYLSVIS